MTYVPGTEIDKPVVDLSGITEPMLKIRKVKRALREAGVSNLIVHEFNKAVLGPSLYYIVDTVIADYVELS